MTMSLVYPCRTFDTNLLVGRVVKGDPGLEFTTQDLLSLGPRFHHTEPTPYEGCRSPLSPRGRLLRGVKSVPSSEGDRIQRGRVFRHTCCVGDVFQGSGKDRHSHASLS